MTTDTAVSFVRDATRSDFSEEARNHLRNRVLDALAATTAGFALPTADVVREYAADHHGGDGKGGDAATLLSGEGGKESTLSEQGAVLVNATAANALDVDDGHREVKGHPAAVVVPPALAAAEAVGATVGELLAAVGVGYELAVRAGLAVHETDGVYTGTGSWGALGAAAAVARLRGLDWETTARALGTAEYHAPRTPIMRGVERPGMTKDGIGWGAYAGTAAVDLAEAGFTAAGTVFDEEGVSATEDLGDHCYLTTGYLKPYPCCRWAQPGVEAVLDLRNSREISPESVETIRVHTFEAATHLGTRRPESVEAAEYSYPYPVAAALARGEFTPAELGTSRREEESVLALADRVEMVVDSDLEARFPAECLARVELVLSDGEGETVSSDVTRAKGAKERPLSDAERRAKAADLFEGPLSSGTVEWVEETLASPSASVEELLGPWRDANESNDAAESGRTDELADHGEV
ncbi:MmgE/PrpD family protein [Halorussus ruber]|uniref:MmgE/PrpD family protein n=1 Tax=Halorussus ruber TaxID=1126238 RepID=UPI0010920652|nr:MmgE/PrpD family protein [Halorussus ruber]